MNSTKSNIYEEILDEIKGDFTLSKMELERICDSQFRVIRDTMSNREGKVVQLIYLGKFRPTIYNTDYTKRKKLKDE
jgi:nucleoid DNA-binding protein